MTQQHFPPEFKTGYNPRFIGRIIIKTLVLFIILNLVFALVSPLETLGKLSLYNRIFPGRGRLPFGERPDQAYNFSLFQLDAMFASHEIAVTKPAHEFRVVLIGDSSTWGFLLRPEETVSAYLNAADLTAPDGRELRFYNLGYPTITLTKDLLILSHAIKYQPDLIIWLTTLEAFPVTKQLKSPIVQNNPEVIRGLIENFNLHLNPNDSAFSSSGFLYETILARRRDLADIFRLQIYGLLWSASGIDQYYPNSFDPLAVDFSDDASFQDLLPPTLNPEDLAFEVLHAGVQLAGDIPILIVNEPSFTSSGENSHIRYNFFYPIWAFDQYRDLLAAESAQNGWHYIDLWDAVPNTEFTNSAIHVTPLGSEMLAAKISSELKEILNAP
jgi:hypothetical protein